MYNVRKILISFTSIGINLELAVKSEQRYISVAPDNAIIIKGSGILEIDIVMYGWG